MGLFAACAEVGPPPGGEVDVNGPMIVASIPTNGALNVAPTDEIVIRFDERVIRPERGKTVFVFPRPTDEPKLKWSADQVRLSLARPFRDHQTYIVALSTELKDLRGNRLRGISTIAFSTGDEIDSGRVSGTISKDNKPTPGVMVALYPERLWSDSVVLDSIYPSYLAATDKDGHFELPYLPADSFRLIGFVDKNDDERFNPFREEFAVADRDAMVGGEENLEDLNLTLTRLDTVTTTITSVATTSDNLIRVRLNKEVTPYTLKTTPGLMALISSTEVSDTIWATGILEKGDDPTGVLTACFDTTVSGIYKLSLRLEQSGDLLEKDSLELAPRTDKVPPEVQEFSPRDKAVHPGQVDITVRFSEPLERSAITDQTFVLWQEEAIVATTTQWLDPATLSLKTAQLGPGHKCRMDITEFEIVDLSGNAMGDTLTSYTFTTFDPETMGSASGQVRIIKHEPTAPPVLLNFVQTIGGQTFDLVVPGSAVQLGIRDFVIELPPGKYLVNGFIDRNNDGIPSSGSILPYELAETRASFADTVVVRARFETAGLEFDFK